MNTLKQIKTYSIIAVLIGFTMISCKKKKDKIVPKEEHEEEIITDVKLIFTNNADPSDVVEAKAKDPDGEGARELAVLDTINLDKSKTYTLTFEIMNNLESPGENIKEEIEAENDEHQFFFSFSNNAFANPLGNGNIDNASDPLNYNDTDGKGNPVGLLTKWETSSTALSKGEFTVRLQHQPDVKTASSTANDGETDFEIKFVLNIK